jgi:glycyl-tRNA synthetase beta chain
MKDILFEIGLEEVPARFVEGLLQALATNFEKILKEKNIQHGAIQTFGTGRRLALSIKDVQEEKPAKSIEIKGPPIKIAFDAAGNPTQVALGFAKKQGVAVSQLQKKVAEGVECLFVLHSEPAAETLKLLPEMFKQLILGLDLPIGMRWGQGDFVFIRPIHWMVALWSETTIPFEISGIKAGNFSRGHRFLNPGSVEIKNAASYVQTLKTVQVLVDVNERREKIKTELQQLGANPESKLGLLNEVAFLTEWPTVVANEFDPKYLKVPHECLVATMGKNQKYFPIYESEKLTHCFCVVGEGVTEKNRENILKGNRRVLVARLEDARFLFEEDLKQPLAALLPKLEKVTYQEKLGSLAQKSERTIKIAEYLCDVLKVSDQNRKDVLRATALLKADLVSNMVKDFTELQGIMGQYYAVASGESAAVSLAIREHYYPRFVGDEIPTQIVSVIAGLADRMETLAGCFSVGLIPKGSGDPYALRRAAQGLVAIILKNNLDLNYEHLVQNSCLLFQAPVGIQVTLGEFIQDRLAQVLKTQNIRYDIVDAVFAGSGESSLLVKRNLAETLMKFSADAGYKNLVDSAVRVSKIAKAHGNTQVETGLFVVPEEKTLFDQFTKNSQSSNQNLLNSYIVLLPTITQFFEKVMVMDKDEKVKANRLALLKNIHLWFLQTADFEKIAI